MNGNRLPIRFSLFWWVIFASVLGTVYSIYQSGIAGPFLLDDSVILDAYRATGGAIHYESLQQFVFDFRPTYLGRPVSFLSFLINDTTLPVSASAFKYTNILIHLLNGVLICWLLIILGRNAFGDVPLVYIAAMIIAAVWLVLPIHSSTVLYVVQRMTQLAVMFSLAALLLFSSATLETKSSKGQCIKFGLSAVLIALAVMSKESGALVFIYLFLLVQFVFKKTILNRITRSAIFFLVYIPCALLLLYLVVNFSRFEASYAYRDFSMSERVLTEARVLWMYLYQIVVPRLSGLGLFHDDIQLSLGMSAPWTTGLSIVSHIVVWIAAWLLRRSLPLFSFGVAWFYVSHILESTIIPLELYFEHRNYLAALGVILAFVGLLKPLMSLIEERFLKPLPAVIAVFFFVLSSVMTAQAALTWSNEEILYSTWAMEKPESKRAQRSWLGYIYEERNYPRAYEYALELTKDFPQDLGFKLNALTASCRIDSFDPKVLENILLSASDLKAHSNAVTSLLYIENLVLNGDCEELNLGDVHDLYNALREVKHKRGHWKSVLFAHEAELYVKQGNFAAAMTALDASISLHANAQKYMRQSTLLLSAGLVELAKERYILALKQNTGRRFSEPDMSKTLNSLGQKINTAMKKQPNQ